MSEVSKPEVNNTSKKKSGWVGVTDESMPMADMSRADINRFTNETMTPGGMDNPMNGESHSHLGSPKDTLIKKVEVKGLRDKQNPAEPDTMPGPVKTTQK